MAGLLGVLVRATRAMRILELGTGAGTSTLDMAQALPTDGAIITLEKNAQLGSTVREAIASAGYARVVTVMIGDAGRYLHKLAGPFDLVVQDSDPVRYAAWHEQLMMLVRPGGTLVTRNLAAAPDYNELLAADSRLTTAFLDFADGVALSVKRKD